ncbi:MAG TPA: hypothetical protein VKR24_07095, partial [Candidatus Limnocylindrales bacterium]|nr:hypothetical protein [Candidatus Limnocylindrales bacterium]
PDCPVAGFCRFAAGDRPAGGPTRRAPRPATGSDFTATTRWLRGRILDRLREAPADTWTRFDGPIGGHDQAAIEVSLRAMARDGLVELDAVSNPSAALARLPIA